MSVADSISAALQRFGRPMLLRRMTLGPSGTQIPLEVSVYGYSRNFSPQQLVGGIVQGDTMVTFSNTEIAAAQWPGPPKKNDELIFDSRKPIIQSVEPRYLGSDVLVYECHVRG